MIGETISHYRILEKIGEGGMGVVYKAEDTKLLRSVALKFLPPLLTSDEEEKSRFIQEARAASALDHPNIAVVHEIDETSDGRSFICMAYYDGQTLKGTLSKGPLNVEEAARIALQIASGLQRAHESGIVHRDIKPGNIIITSQREVKIVDFGLAKLAAQTKATRSTLLGGTAAYMAPEQILGAEVDARSDLFSLGVVLYEMATGRRPFVGDHEPALFYSILNTEPDPPSTLRSDVSPELERIILHLLEKDPAKRYQHAFDVRDDLKRALGEAPTAHPIRLFPTVLRHKLSTPVLAGAAVIILVALLVASGLVQKWIGQASIPDRIHIAVLPFTTIGGDSNSIVLSNGLFEIISRKLAQLRAFRADLLVFEPGATRRITSANEAYRTLGATIAVDCIVQWESNRAQVTVSLEDAKTSLLLNSRTVQRGAVTLSQLEDGVIDAIAEMIGIQVNPADVRGLAAGGSRDERAHDLYVQARGELLDYSIAMKLGNAIGFFGQAIKIDPQYVLAYAGLGEAYWRRYEATRDRQWVDSALTYVKQAVNLNNNLAEVHLSLGMIYRGSGEDSLAILEFQGILAKDSLNVDAHRELGDAYKLAGDTTKAEASYKKAISIQPNDWRGYNYLGKYYYSRYRNEETIEMWKRVIKLRPENAAGYSNLGAVYYRIGRWRDAREQFEQAIAKDSSNYYSYSNLGTLYYYDGMFDLSAKAYEKALKLNASNHRFWANLAASYHAMGSTKIAQEAYEKAAELIQQNLKVNPRDAKSLATLAGYFADLGKKDRALPLIQRALSLASNDADILGHVGKVYEQLGEREQALKWLGEALKRGYATTDIDYGPEMKGLREDSRYQKLLKETREKK